MCRYDYATNSVDCARCGGEGVYNEEKCYECGGCGWVNSGHEYERDVDAYIDERRIENE